MPARQAVFPADRHALYEAHGYSAAIRSGDLLFVSGQVGSRPDGSPEPVFEAQVRLAFANLRAVLDAAGCTWADVVDVTSFHTDPEAQIGTVLTVKADEIGPPPYPNWTALGVNWLAGFDFEIKVIARIPDAGDAKIEQGTPAWFEMVGTVMSDAAASAGLSPDHNVSLVERYTDAADVGGGLVQGFRFDITGGKPSYRVGVRPDERGDITVEVASAAARHLNQLHGEEAAAARARYLASGEIREDGDLSRLGAWFDATHERIVARTR